MSLPGSDGDSFGWFLQAAVAPPRSRGSPLDLGGSAVIELEVQLVSTHRLVTISSSRYADPGLRARVTTTMIGATMIRTQRLTMTAMSCEVMCAIMTADWQRADELLGSSFPTEWRSDAWGWLAPRVVEGHHDARLLAWGTRLARLIDGWGPVVAEVGFHGPPDGDRWVEIGYRVVAGYRRRGFAEEACRSLLDWAVAQGVTGVRAAISPDNDASVRLALKLGFTPAGSAHHEVLGEQLIYERPRPS